MDDRRINMKLQTHLQKRTRSAARLRRLEHKAERLHIPVGDYVKQVVEKWLDNLSQLKIRTSVDIFKEIMGE
jgi:hypothetical protein